MEMHGCKGQTDVACLIKGFIIAYHWVTKTLEGLKKQVPG